MQALSINDLVVKLCVSKATIYRLIRRGKFPVGVSLSGYPGKGSTRWLSSDVDAWLKKQFGGAK